MTSVEDRLEGVSLLASAPPAASERPEWLYLVRAVMTAEINAGASLVSVIPPHLQHCVALAILGPNDDDADAPAFDGVRGVA